MIWPLLLAATLLLAEDKPWVKVQGQVGMAPCTVRVTVHYPAGAYAYYVALVDETGPITTSFKENPPKTYQFPDFRDMPEGTYEAQARVVGLDGKTYQLDRVPVMCKGVGH